MGGSFLRAAIPPIASVASRSVQNYFQGTERTATSYPGVTRGMAPQAPAATRRPSNTFALSADEKQTGKNELQNLALSSVRSFAKENPKATKYLVSVTATGTIESVLCLIDVKKLKEAERAATKLGDQELLDFLKSLRLSDLGNVIKISVPYRMYQRGITLGLIEIITPENATALQKLGASTAATLISVPAVVFPDIVKMMAQLQSGTSGGVQIWASTKAVFVHPRIVAQSSLPLTLRNTGTFVAGTLTGVITQQLGVKDPKVEIPLRMTIMAAIIALLYPLDLFKTVQTTQVMDYLKKPIAERGEAPKLWDSWTRTLEIIWDAIRELKIPAGLKPRVVSMATGFILSMIATEKLSALVFKKD